MFLYFNGISFLFEKRSNALTHRFARNALQRKEKLRTLNCVLQFERAAVILDCR
jgi:hypothetical protein